MVNVVHWNPRRRLGTGKLTRRIRTVGRVNNFGDLLGPLLVAKMLEIEALPTRGPGRLLAVGSILHLARVGDTIWGSGVNGKVLMSSYPHVDVRAVRGPRTAEVLRGQGISVPEIYGDPALLIPELFSDDELGVVRGTGGTVLVPNFHDRTVFPREALDPRGDPIEKIRIIASAERVVASSLHGVIIAEAFGVPVVPVKSHTETDFKYVDYYEGTGRSLPRLSPDWRTALNVDAPAPVLHWDPAALRSAFPRDLWLNID